MARVFIDVHMFSVEWFNKVLPELIRAESVRFSYGLTRKLLGEQEKVKKALEFYKLMGALGKRDDADQAEIERRVEFLEAHESWISCGACDDPHIFAIVFAKPTRYVFSQDARIATCRSVMTQVVDNRYCRFRLVGNEANYLEHRPHILT